MFKLQLTFVFLALISAVLSSPIPAPDQKIASSQDLQTLDIPGLSTVTGLLGGLLGGGGGGDNSDDSTDDTGDNTDNSDNSDDSDNTDNSDNSDDSS